MKNNDSVILGLKKEIEAKKKLLKSSIKFIPTTNCSLFLNTQRYNLHTLSKEQIVFLAANLQAIKDASIKVFPEEKLIIEGYLVDEWITDLKCKYSILNKTLEEQRLKNLEAKLHNLLSNNTKVSLELEELRNQI